MKKLLLISFFVLQAVLYGQDKNMGGTPVSGVKMISRAVTQSTAPALDNNARPATTTLSPGTPTGGSQEVGITEGQLDVSLTGAATYSIPIALPPGINGVMPQIGLVYSSQAGNGMAGYGWNLSGISGISRIPATIYHDGVNDPVDYDALDRFALDGQRLIRKSGTYGANGTVYETENFSNLKITSVGVSPYGANFGPASFIVEYPDGSIAHYGTTIYSQTKNEWGINTWKNLQNIVITYNYALLINQSPRVTNIQFGNTTSSSSINEINFIYKNRNRPETGYNAGQYTWSGSILSEINILGGGIGFRNYYLAHNITSLGYERLVSITEKSGDKSKSLNPTVFSYDDTSNSGLFNPLPQATLNVSGVTSLNSESVQGDFDGDGKTDLILYPKLGAGAMQKYWLYKDINSANQNYAVEHEVGYFITMFPISFLGGGATTGYKLMPQQGWNVVANNQATNTTTFRSYCLGFTNPILQQDVKSYQFPKFVSGYFNECINGNKNAGSSQNSTVETDNRIVDPIGGGPVYIVIEKIIPKEYLNGDFNGDGITDLIVREKPVNYSVQSGCNTIAQTYNSGLTYFINLDKRLTTNYANISGTIEAADNSKLIVADVNGDGKSDILVFDAGRVIVYTLNDAKQLVELFRVNDGGIKMDKPILMGDYNGDGKLEFAIPQIDNADVWSFFTSTGLTFNKTDIAIGLMYFTSQSGFFGFEGWHNNTYSTGRFNYLSSDFNGDGKTDLAVLRNYSVEYIWRIGPQGERILDMSQKGTSQRDSVILSENRSSNGGNYSFFSPEFGPIIWNSGINTPITVLTNHNQINTNLEYSLISGNRIFSYKCPKDTRQDVLLRKITTGLGVTEAITYKQLQDNAPVTDGITLYKPSTYTENFPSFDIKTAPGFQVVAKLEKQSQNTYKKQLFAYYGAVSNLDGQGFLGFRSLLRTNWFNDNLQLISSVSKHDINLKGANVASYTYLNTSFDFELIPSGFISKSISSYNTTLSPSKVFKIANTSSTSYDGLSGTSKTVTATFDAYNNPTSNTATSYTGTTVDQTETASIAYDAPSTSPLIIGRPNKKNVSITHSGNTLTSEELFTYNGNNLLSQIKKKGHMTNYIVEDNIYDTFGNITQKTINAAPLAPRVTKYEYDTTGRFLIKSTDIEGLHTIFEFDLIGLLKSETNPYGLKTQHFYDVWHKKYKTTDYLGKSAYTTYTKQAPAFTIINTTSDDGSAGMVKYDDLGREIVSGAKLIDGQWSYTKTDYDDYDRKSRVYEPVADANYGSFSTAFTYDNYGRLVKTVEPTSKTTTISYNGLSNTVADGTKTVTTTKNSIGNTLSVTDNGGTINYTYFANGNLKTSNFDGTVISMEYDGWGKKIKLTDPSAGTYRYEYNALGETTKEIKPSPKGEIEYVLDNFGKIIGKNVSSTDNLTKSKTTYSYDGTTKLLSGMSYNDLTDGSTTDYTYTYDAFKRLIKTTEDNPATAYFEKRTEYDAFGRPERQLNKAIHYPTGKESSKWVKNTYKNGAPWQILDDATNAVLWETSIVNSKGQLVIGKYGNEARLINTYDNYGFATKMQYDRFDDTTVDLNTNNFGSYVSIMTLNTQFERIRRNLTSRSNSLYSTTTTTTELTPDGPITTTTTVPTEEVFKYDTLDRLTSWGAAPEQLFSLAFSMAKPVLLSPDPPLPANFEQFTPVNTALLSNTHILNKLNIATTAANSGAERLVLPAVTSGTRFNLKATINKLTTNKIRVVAVEKNIALGTEVAYELGLANEGLFDVNYTVTTSGTDLYFRFVKSPLSTDVGLLKNFRIDNVEAYKLFGETQEYDNKGRITKNILGEYNYKIAGKQYQNSSVKLTPDADAYYQNKQIQNITYNAFKSPVQIREEGTEIMHFSYNTANDRSAMYYGGLAEDRANAKRHKFYDASGSMEIKFNLDGNQTEFITYIGGDAYSAPVVYKSDGDSQEEYLYLHRDYQGSILAITNQAGAVVEKRQFDPWGAIVSVQNGDGDFLAGFTILDRGYTGHEHLESVGLINMNGRIYDPKLHRFLQPDNYVQDPSNTQNYNRYGYCLNNPSKYTDYSGELFGWDDLAVAAIGGLINWGANGFQFNAAGLSHFGIGMAAGIATYYGGPMAGAAVLGVGNSITNQLSTTGKIDGWQVFSDTATTMVFSAAGTGITRGLSPYLDPVFTSAIGNSVLRESVKQALYGATSGFIIGGAVTGAQGGSINDVLKGAAKGAGTGAVTGAVTGAMQGHIAAKAAKVASADHAIKPQAKITTIDLVTGPDGRVTLARPLKAEDGPYLKSSLQLGNERHSDYYRGVEGKEYRLDSGKRIDYLDVDEIVIRELKPFNPRAIQQGIKQLNIYKFELQQMPRFQNTQIRTVLDVYHN